MHSGKNSGRYPHISGSHGCEGRVSIKHLRTLRKPHAVDGVSIAQLFLRYHEQAVESDLLKLDLAELGPSAEHMMLT